MNKNRQVAKYLIFDFLASAISWTVFFIYRKAVIEPQLFGIEIPIEFTNRYYLGLVLISIFWIIFYYITGFYKDILRRSRLLELGQTFSTSVVGVIVIFFALILDDFIHSYKNYYQLFFTLLILHFSLTYFFRLILTTRTIHRIHKRKIGFNTLIIGSTENAIKIYKDMSNQVRPAGNLFVGFVGVENNNDALLSQYIPKLGNLENLAEIIETQHQANNIEILPIGLPHVLTLDNLPFHHKDPFDRLIIADSMAHAIPLLTRDRKIRKNYSDAIWD